METVLTVDTCYSTCCMLATTLTVFCSGAQQLATS